MKQGAVTFIPKPNKDKLSLDNWRPITLLRGDYKLLTHVYANRPKKGISKIIDKTQSAFIKGRHIHNHTCLVLDILDGFTLFIDFFLKLLTY